MKFTSQSLLCCFVTQAANEYCSIWFCSDGIFVVMWSPGFSLLFDRLHGLHDLLLLDAKLLLLFGFPIFATEISVITSIVPRLRLLEDLVERAMIILQRKHARIFGLRHGWDWIKGASRPEKIGQILWHFFFGDVAHHTVVPEVSSAHIFLSLLLNFM